MGRWFYLNGEFVEENQATLPLTQTGFQRAYGIFDLFRTEQGKPRFLADYLDRFENSQKFLGLSRAISRKEVTEAVKTLQEKNGYEHSTFKLILMGDGLDDTSTHYDPFFGIINTRIHPEQQPREISVITHEYLREYPEIKSLNYFTSYSLHRKRIAAEAQEVVYHKNDQVSEASRCNIFAIKDGTLFTADQGILHGITRLHVLKVARQIMPVQMGLSLDTFLHADELFATSTMKDVMPIAAVDQSAIAGERILTRKLQQAFREYVNDL